MSRYRKIFEVESLPRLGELFADAGLKAVDVGGRGKGFPGLLPIAGFVDYFASEPETTEANRLEATAGEQPWKSVTVIREALAQESGVTRLFVTKKPGMSSLLRPNPEVLHRFYAPDNLGKLSIQSVQDVQAIPLDAAAERYGFADAAFLKLDTQGTELDILKSGRRLLPSLQAVYVEVAFQAFYSEQPLFADVDSFLRANGFVLFVLNRTSIRRRAGYKPSSYTQHQVAWAHCLYFREPDTVADRAALTRLLALALSLQCFDVAFEAAALLRLPDAIEAEIERCAAVATHAMLHGDESPEALAALTARVTRDDRKKSG